MESFRSTAAPPTRHWPIPGAAGGSVTLAYCWSHVRRRFYEIAQGGNAAIAEEALQRINALYHVEAMIRGHAPEQRQAVRDEQSKPVVNDLRTWLDVHPTRARSGWST